MVERSITSIVHKEIRETFNRIDEEIERIGWTRCGNRKKRSWTRRNDGRSGKKGQTRRTQDSSSCEVSINKHEEELKYLKVLDPINGHERSTKALLATIVDHPHFEYYGKVQFSLLTTAIHFPCFPYIFLFNTCESKTTGIEGQTTLEDSPIELVNFELSNFSHVHSKETSMKKTSYTCKVLDEMPKRDLDVLSLYSGPIERNNKTEAFEDLLCDAFFIDNESDVEAFENMHLGWLFLNDVSNMDTKSLDSDWKEVLSWQACSDTILSKIMTSCELWLNLESNQKTCQCEEIEKLLFLITGKTSTNCRGKS